MDTKQESEWAEAQNIQISEDLVAAAKRQLRFLAAVDRSRWLYEGPALLKAIFRYNAYWLPLLAKHHEKQLTEGPLVVPLDCEWIWHCHRLNPIRYKMDCMKLYGRILDNSTVVSSTQGASKTGTELVWKRLFSDEPYELDLTSLDISVKGSKAENFTDYDLVSAVQRQSPFYYQVSRPYVNTDVFLKGALARYKGFLHMIRSNRKRSIRRFCVPTYDIDLLWHTHQLHPLSYCKDMVATLGKILEHDDMDADRSKGAKLDVGFSGTTKQWEDSFGTRYWRAGAMYRGSAPTPVTKTPYPFNVSAKKVVSLDDHKILQLPERKYVEVHMEIVDVMNLPEGVKGSPCVIFRKNEPDASVSTKRRVSISSQAKNKDVAIFQCEPNGDIYFELMHHKHSHLPLSKLCKVLGSTSFSISEFLSEGSALSVEKWFELVPSAASDDMKLKPASLRIALSFTLPTSAPYVLQMAHQRSFIQNACFFPVPGKVKQSKSWTPVLDDAGKEILSLQMRDSTNRKEGNNTASNEVFGLTKSGEVKSLAHKVGSTWLSADSQWSLKKSDDTAYLFELVGTRAVRLYSGRKLEFQPNHCAKQRSELDFITAVEFSSENPYGTAVALFELKSGFITVKEEWFLVPGITFGFIVAEILKKGGYKGLSAGGGNSVETVYGVPLAMDELCLESVNAKSDNILETVVMLENEIASSGGCGGGCGGGSCGNMVKSGGCGGCGSGCGGCGGGGCGNMVKSGGCGGCGGGCGGCGGGCGNMVKSGGCGGCGGGCGGCGGGFENNATTEGLGTYLGGTEKSTFCGGSGGCGGCGGRGLGDTEKSTFCGGSGGCGGCGGRGLEYMEKSTFCGGSGGCGGCGGRGLEDTEKSTFCGGSGGCGGCGVNSTDQTGVNPLCNQEGSQQLAVGGN